jgi:hypothetical protein
MRVAAGDTTFQVKVSELGVEKMRIPKFGPVPTDHLSRIWIDYSLRPEQHSLTDLPRDFDGEIVIVGTTAQGLANPIATPRGEMFPQELQSAIIGTIITNRDGQVITHPWWADAAEIGLIFVLGLLLIVFTVIGRK